jgi:hypothetical protein
VVTRFSSGLLQTRDITVGETPIRTIIDDRMSKVD